MSEAEEVLACVKETVPESRNEPYNQDHLTTLRRSFHTLKGSGRMVGLLAFGEAAWSIEQVLNLRLSETRAGDADLYALLDKAGEVLGAWVADLQIQGKSDRTPKALARAAERVKMGGAFLFDETAIPEARAEAIDLVEQQQPYAAGAELASEAAPQSDPAAEAGQTVETAPEDDDAQGQTALPQAEEVELSDADLAALRGGDATGLLAANREPEPAAPPAFDAARIATEREPAVATIEVRGFFASFGASDARIRFQFRYRAPNESRFGK